MGDRSRPQSDADTSLPHGDAREKQQPYAAEHDDYTDGVAKPPREGQGGQSPPNTKKPGSKKR